ncbi:MAG: hypothetical protein IT366_16285 [Candidatus Hydrogenedentes bacterium]|nr:hypothetical protein [Candidatus Hydrogenedentota bacterium]
MTIPVPPSISTQPEARMSPLRLFGFDVSANGTETPINPITFKENVKLEFTLHWVPLGKVPAGSTVTIRMAGGGPKLEREYNVEVPGGQVGMVVQQRVTFPYDGMRCSGDATLTIHTRGDSAVSSPESLQYVGPIHALPLSFASPIAEEAIKKVFGQQAIPVSSRFRLGPGATLRLDVHAAPPINGLAIVSATGYDGNPTQGDRVCAVRLLDAAGALLAESYIEQGVTTAKSDYDYYPAGTLNTKRIAFFDTMPAPAVNKAGQPYLLYTFAATLPLASPTAPAFIEFEYLLNDFVLDVKGLALIPAQGTPK